MIILQVFVSHRHVLSLSRNPSSCSRCRRLPGIAAMTSTWLYMRQSSRSVFTALNRIRPIWADTATSFRKHMSKFICTTTHCQRTDTLWLCFRCWNSKHLVQWIDLPPTISIALYFNMMWLALPVLPAFITLKIKLQWITRNLPHIILLELWNLISCVRKSCV